MKTRRKRKNPFFALLGIFLVFSSGFYLDLIPAAAAPIDVVLNEIAAYEADGHEWLEILNTGAEPVDLSGWVFYENGSNHSLSLHQGADMIIGVGEYAIIADIAENFVLDYPGFTGLVLDSSWSSLSESGEPIELRASGDPLDTIESFTYIAAPDYSLERANPLLNDYTAANWQEHPGSNTAGAENSNYNAGSAVCGNGNMEPGEECDDGNTASGDGCSSLCLLETNDSLEGTVVLTVTPDAVPAQNIGPAGVDIVFSVNGDADAVIYYGTDNTYGDSTAAEAVLENMEKTISLSGLSCGTEYHYSIYAENTGTGENDQIADAVFDTLPCGITVDSLSITKTGAKANNNYTDGWEWRFGITVWNMDETNLKMKFQSWTGGGALDAGGNMQYSIDDGLNWFDISENGVYPALAADLAGIDNDGEIDGRQVQVKVRMKVPAGTPVGNYGSSYGILTEIPAV